jgi:hypothetical protein
MSVRPPGPVQRRAAGHRPDTGRSPQRVRTTGVLRGSGEAEVVAVSSVLIGRPRPRAHETMCGSWPALQCFFLGKKKPIVSRACARPRRLRGDTAATALSVGGRVRPRRRRGGWLRPTCARPRPQQTLAGTAGETPSMRQTFRQVPVAKQLPKNLRGVCLTGLGLDLGLVCLRYAACSFGWWLMADAGLF